MKPHRRSSQCNPFESRQKETAGQSERDSGNRDVDTNRDSSKSTAVMGVRQVQTYPIQRNELDIMESYNVSANIWWAVTAASVTAIVTNIIDIFPRNFISGWDFSWRRLLVLMVFSGVAFVASKIARNYGLERRKLVQQIERESVFCNY